MKGVKYLLDTNICVFFLRKKFKIGDKIKEIGIDNCYISEITVAELLYGANCSDNPVKNLEIVKSFCKDFNVISISECLETFAIEKSNLRKMGILIDDFDLLIASTAIENNFILVTDNVKHFKRLDIKIENWVNR